MIDWKESAETLKHPRNGRLVIDLVIVALIAFVIGMTLSTLMSTTMAAVIGLAIGGTVAMIFDQVGSSRRLADFIAEVFVELDATTWPTKDDIMNSTVIVLITVLFFSVYIGIIDFVLTRFMSGMYAMLG